MRLFELVEGMDEDYRAQARAFVQHVKLDCAPYLQAKPNGVNLSRGMTGKSTIILGGTAQNVRVYQYSDTAFTAALHAMMLQAGFTATRHNSMFCVSQGAHEEHGMTRFGPNYIVFPIGAYELTWFDSKALGTDDLGNNTWVNMAQKIIYDNDEDIGEPWEDGGAESQARALNNPEKVAEVFWAESQARALNNPEKVAEVFWAAYGDDFHHGTDVAAAFAAGSEIMVRSAGFHAIRYSLWHYVKKFLP